MVRCIPWYKIYEGGWGVYQITASFAHIIECRRIKESLFYFLGVGVRLLPT